jgi:hypothetical protein
MITKKPGPLENVILEGGPKELSGRLAMVPPNINRYEKSSGKIGCYYTYVRTEDTDDFGLTVFKYSGHRTPFTTVGQNE